MFTVNKFTLEKVYRMLLFVSYNQSQLEELATIAVPFSRSYAQMTKNVCWFNELKCKFFSIFLLLLKNVCCLRKVMPKSPEQRE